VSTPTAGDITVHRCVVRVIRRGGWSWGPDPRDLVRQVVNALPGLLAERFAEPLSDNGSGDGSADSADDSGTVEITEPVTITVRLGRSGAASLTELLADVVVEAPGAPVVKAEERSVALPSPPSFVAASPAELFAALALHDELAPLLALLPEASLRTYLLAVLADPAAGEPFRADETVSGETSLADGTVTGMVVAEYARRIAPRPVPTTRAELLRQLRTAPVDTVPGPVSPALAAETAAVVAEPEVLTPAASTAREPDSVPPVAVTTTPIEAGETRTCGALPFLLAGALARTGYLDAIGPALAGVELLAEAPLFAAALAYKVLGAPERGWRRTRADHVTAAAFAGLDDVPDLADFEDRARHALPVLDGLLALGVSRGHDPADPLLIAGVDDGLLLVDAQGMFPVAWSRDVAGLLPHWIACGRPSVAVCDSPLPADCLRALAAEGMNLVTDVRPLRGDPLTRLPRPAPLWTAGTPDPRLVAALPSCAERLTELVSAFSTRRAVPRSDDGALDRSALLAAATGLGLIAWTLWHDRESPDPVLALTRFADLEVTVRYRADSVHVRLPLGRRHADLLNHGLLTDVPDVVWLGGRPLTFSGG
jgi:hypothetical protein